MTFTSYAQNFEDILLWRALKHIDNGFYIDVGANDPTIDSVTKAFYDIGWRGINVEPDLQWFTKLESERPRDINLQCAAGKRKEDIEFYVLPDTGLSTSSKVVAEKHKKEKGYEIKVNQVTVRTLTDICEEYQIKTIHFLKIDVETAEKAVLEGLNLEIIRPWILVIEATLPNSQLEDFKDWEQMLLDNQYEFAYFDGLNRYYVANEQILLAESFRTPPNIFDDVRLINHSWCRDIIKDRYEALSQLELEKLEHQKCLVEKDAVFQEQLACIAQESATKLTNKDANHQRELACIAQENAAELADQEVCFREKLATLELKIIGGMTNRSTVELQQQINQQELSWERQLIEVERKYLKHLLDKDEIYLQLLASNDSLLNMITEIEVKQEMCDRKITEAVTNEVDFLQQSLEQEQRKTEWLQDEWKLSKLQVENLKLESNRWWQATTDTTRELELVYQSKSWLITSPLRKVMPLFTSLLALPYHVLVWLIHLPKKLFSQIVFMLMTFVFNRPVLERLCTNGLNRFPSLFAKLRQFGLNRGLVNEPCPDLTNDKVTAANSVSNNLAVNESIESERDNCDAKLMWLPPHAQQIYHELNKAMDKNNKGRL